jgi:hypothetical protein
MLRSNRFLIAFAVLAFAGTTGLMMAQTPDKPDVPTVTPADATRNLDPDARIEAALSKKTTTDYYELPLKDAIMHLADAFQIPIVLERKAMFEFGMSDEDPVSLALNDVRLDSALNIILGQLDLTYLVEDGVLKVTPVQTAVDRIQTKIYDPQMSDETLNEYGNQLIELIKALDPYRCEKSHAVQLIAGKMVVVADYQTQRKVAALFAQLKAAGISRDTATGVTRPNSVGKISDPSVYPEPSSLPTPTFAIPPRPLLSP